MKIIITDENTIWTVGHPALEPFAESVYVVCLNGKKVTDKYHCFLLNEQPAEPEATGPGKDPAKYCALENAAHQLMQSLGEHEDLVFLTDTEPASLFPFHAIRAVNENHSLHLVAVSPWNIEDTDRKKAKKALLRDLHSLDSLLYIDVQWLKWESEASGKSLTKPELTGVLKKKCEELLPDILFQIRHREWKKAFFDLHSMKYLPLEEGAAVPQPDPVFEADAETGFVFAGDQGAEAGPLLRPSDPAGDESALQEIEPLVPRVDGNIVCFYLKLLRKQLADANGIPYKLESCPFRGPCAGTCAKCDGESAWLRDEMEKIPVEKRVYPRKTLRSWGMI